MSQLSPEELYKFVCGSGLLDFIRKDSEAELDRLLKAVPEATSFLSETAKNDLKRGYCARIEAIYAHPAAVEISNAMRSVSHDPTVDLHKVETALLRDAVENALSNKDIGSDPGSYFRNKYPMIPELESRIQRNYHDSQKEFLDNVIKARTQISTRFFQGKEITLISSLTGMGGDVHRHGRAVTGVRTDAGTFYYKPHDCHVDAMYKEIVQRMFADCTEAADCILINDCGFVTELKASPIDTHYELHDYYENFGKLAALMHGIGANDMHAENILPCGTKPAAIDLETMLNPIVRSLSKAGGIISRIELPCVKEYSNSALRTGIFPEYLQKIGLISPLFLSTIGRGYLPVVNGTEHPITGYEEDFLRGFHEGYRRVMDQRDVLRSILTSYQGAQIRILLRNSAYYSILKERLYRAEALSSAKKQQALLDRLRVPYLENGFDVDERIVAFETESLLEGDIPYYCTSMESLDLCGNSLDEVLHRNYMVVSARDRCFRKLDSLSVKEEQFENDIIRCCLRQIPSPCGKSIPVPLPEKSKEAVRPRAFPADERPDREVLEDALRKITEDVFDNRIHTSDGSLFWRSEITSVKKLYTCSHLTILSGIGLFLSAQLLSSMPIRNKDAVMALASECTINQNMYLEHILKEDPKYILSTYPLGIFNGMGGVIIAAGFLHKADVSGSDRTILLLTKFLTDVLESAGNGIISRMQKTGEIAGLLLSIGLCQNFEIQKPIKSLADELLSSIAESKKIIPSDLAASGAALSYAGKLTGNALYVQEAERLFQQVRGAYVESLSGWRDENHSITWLAPRGTQTAFIGLCALFSSKCLAKEEARTQEEILHLALESLLKEEYLWHSDALMHGNSLAVIFLALTGRETGGKPELKKAEDILSAMIRRRGQNGFYSITPDGLKSFFDPLLSAGTPGIGLSFIIYDSVINAL